MGSSSARVVLKTDDGDAVSFNLPGGAEWRHLGGGWVEWSATVGGRGRSFLTNVYMSEDSAGRRDVRMQTMELHGGPGA